MTVVAERALDYFGTDGAAAGVLRVDAPKPDQNNWRCDFAVSWPGFERRHRVMGVDSYQPLLLALHAVGSEIAGSEDFKAGRIGVFGERIRTRRELKEAFDLHRLPGFDP